MIRTLVGQKYMKKLWVRLKMMQNYHSETPRLQTMIPQNKLSIILQTLLTWQHKQPYYIAKKKKSSLNSKHNVLVKSFLSVTITLLCIGVTEHEFSTMHKRHFLCHYAPTSQRLPVLLFRGVTARLLTYQETSHLN